MTFSEEIKQYALSLGFDACGICRAEESEQEVHYRRWLLEECHAGMGYLERNIDKRMDPRMLVERAKSIISVALNYFPHRFQHEDAPKFAYYAYGEDYHDIVKGKLSRLHKASFSRGVGALFLRLCSSIGTFLGGTFRIGVCGQKHVADHSRKRVLFFSGRAYC